MADQKLELTAPFSVADFVSTAEDVAVFLDAVLAEGDNDYLIAALRDIAKSKGMSEVAARAGVNRESLYRTLREGRDARLSTITKVLRACGLRLTVVPLEPDDAA